MVHIYIYVADAVSLNQLFTTMNEGYVKFLKDTKHILQIIENINEKINKGELSLEGVSLVSLDVDKMYNNITSDLGRGAAKTYLDSRPAHPPGDDNSDPFISTESLLEGLDLCTRVG